MKNNKRKVWKTGVIAGMLAMLVLAFSACGSEPEESSTAEAIQQVSHLMYMLFPFLP